MTYSRKWEPKSHDMKVKPLSKEKIWRLAKKTRSDLGVNVPIDLEKLLNDLAEEEILDYEIVPDSEMPDCYGVTIGKFITFRESVFLAIADESHSDHNIHRFTVAHEIGHAMLHKNIRTEGFARRIKPKAAYESAEWQADTFAGYLLVPNRAIERSRFNASDISALCRVSQQCAEITVRKYESF